MFFNFLKIHFIVIKGNERFFLYFGGFSTRDPIMNSNLFLHPCNKKSVISQRLFIEWYEKIR